MTVVLYNDGMSSLFVWFFQGGLFNCG